MERFALTPYYIEKNEGAVEFRADILAHILFGLAFPSLENNVIDDNTPSGISYATWKRTGSLGLLLDVLALYPRGEYVIPLLPVQFLRDYIIPHSSIELLSTLLVDEVDSMGRAIFKGLDLPKAAKSSNWAILPAAKKLIDETNAAVSGGSGTRNLPILALHLPFQGSYTPRLDFLVSNLVVERGGGEQHELLLNHIQGWACFWSNSHQSNHDTAYEDVLLRIKETDLQATLLNLFLCLGGFLSAFPVSDKVVEKIIGLVVEMHDCGGLAAIGLQRAALLVASLGVGKIPASLEVATRLHSLIQNALSEPEYALSTLSLLKSSMECICFLGLLCLAHSMDGSTRNLADLRECIQGECSSLARSNRCAAMWAFATAIQRGLVITIPLSEILTDTLAAAKNDIKKYAADQSGLPKSIVEFSLLLCVAVNNLESLDTVSVISKRPETPVYFKSHSSSRSV